MKKFLLTLLALGAGGTALPLSGWAQFKFITNADNTITITAYTGSGGIVTIPSATNGYPVTSIGDGAFFGCSFLTNVTIGNSITNIGNRAFQGCFKLLDVTIPIGVTNIGYEAFFGCSQLTNVMIPKNVTSIGYETFTTCSSLTNIAVDAANPSYASVGGVLFNKSLSTLIEYPGGLVGSYTIPNSVSNIGDFAFDYCSFLTSLTIPNSTTNIGIGAFGSCLSLTNLVIPNSVTSIGTWAFELCSNLTSVTISNSITSIGEHTFYCCYNLTNVTIPNSVTSIGTNAFYRCYGLTSMTIPGSVTNFNTYVFQNCTNLHQAYFQGNAPTVNGGAGSTDSTVFSGETGTAYYLPGTTGWGATFGGWPTADLNDPATNFVYITNSGAITITGYLGAGGNVSIPVGINSYPVTTIGTNAFYTNKNFTSIIIPDSVTSLGSNSFYGCFKLTNAVIGNGVTNIGDYAFYACSDVTNVTIGNHVTSIGSYAFGILNRLPNVTIPNSVTSIGSWAFFNCSFMTRVSIPNSVTSIGTNAFAYCNALLKAYFPGNAPTVNGGAGSADSTVFQYDLGGKVYYLPNTTGWGATFGGWPTVLWNPQVQTTDNNFGIRTNRFGFNLTGTASIPVVVEACTNLGGAWTPLFTGSVTNGSVYFSDPQWTNYPQRFYRVHSP